MKNNLYTKNNFKEKYIKTNTTNAKYIVHDLSQFTDTDSEIDKKAQPLITKINNLLSNPSATVQDIKQLKSKIKQFRQSGLEDKGEYSLENLAFKKLRNEGYLQKLKDLEIKITTQSFDLNEKTNN